MARWITVLVLSVGAWYVQGQPGPLRLTFDVASVHPSARKPDLPGPFAAMPATGTSRGGPGTADPERVVYSGVSLTFLLLRAFAVGPGQISAPDWLDHQTFDVEAKMPPGTTKEQFQEMLRNLLFERFGLVVHYETRQGMQSAYTLVRAKGGSKLKPSGEPAKAASVTVSQNQGMVTVTFHRYTLADFAKWLQRPLANTQQRNGYNTFSPAQVLDETGLTGEYDFTIEFAGSRGPRNSVQPVTLPPSGPSAQDSGGASLFTALQQQLGLRLEETKSPLTMLIVDHAERVPADN